MLTIRHRPRVLFSEQILISCSKVVAPHYKRGMEPLTVLGIFLLGASAGSLITMIRYRHELGCLRAQFDQIQGGCLATSRRAHSGAKSVTLPVQTGVEFDQARCSKITLAASHSPNTPRFSMIRHFML